MDAVNKIALVVATILILIVAGISFLGNQNNNVNQSIGTLSLANYDDAVTKAGFSINQNIISATERGISCTSIFPSDYYGGITGTSINLNARIKVNWVDYDLDMYIPHYHQMKGYRFEYYYRTSTVSWTKMVTNPPGISFSAIPFNYIAFDGMQPAGLSIPQGGTTVYINKNINVDFDDTFNAIGFRIKLFVTLDDDKEALIGTEEAIIFRDDLKLIVNTVPDACTVTVDIPTTPTSRGYSAGTIISENGVASFVLGTIPSRSVYVIVEKEDYKTVEQWVEMDDSKSILIKLIQWSDVTYNVTVRMTPGYSDAYIDDTMLHSLSDGVVKFKNVAFGSHTLKVEKDVLWEPSTQTIFVEKDMDISVNLEKIYIPVNNPPIAESISEQTGRSSGYLHGEYDFVIDAYDEDGDMLTYEIDWGDGVKIKQQETTASKSWGALGKYEITVRAYDGDLWSDWSDSYDFTVTNTLDAFIYGGNSGQPGIIYEFRAYPSSSSLRYKFNWGDGTDTGWLTKSTATKTYLTAGTFTVSVQITDGVTQVQDGMQFTVETENKDNKMPKPIITAGDCEIGRSNSAKIEVFSDATASLFDIYVVIKDKNGNNIIPASYLDKKFTGDSYVSTITFTCDILGNITITAQTIPSHGTTGLISSDTATKTIRCYETGEDIYGDDDYWNPTEPVREPADDGTNLYNPQQNTNKTPGFEIIIIIFAIALIVSVRRKRWIKQK